MTAARKDASAPRAVHRGGRFRYGCGQAEPRLRNSRPSCPIRGKILNCLKADYARIFKSDIITDLHQGHGLRRRAGRQATTKTWPRFNLDNLRLNKVVICTDADVDGYQIRTLVLTMLYRLTPTLINKGYVYIAESPLYEINDEERDVLCLHRAGKG